MHITQKTLVDLNACLSSRDVFSQAFPDGAYLTRADLEKAYAVGLDVDWFGSQVFGDLYESPGLRDTYKRLNDACDRARRAYDRTMGEGADPDRAWGRLEASLRAANHDYHQGIIDHILDLAKEEGCGGCGAPRTISQK